MKLGSWLIFEKESKFYATKYELQMLAEQFSTLLLETAEKIRYNNNRELGTQAMVARQALNEPFSETEIVALAQQAKAAGIDDKTINMGQLALRAGLVSRKVVHDFMKAVMR